MALDTLSEFLGRVRGGSCVFRPAYTPLLSAGDDLGNQAALLRHGTLFPSFWAGLGIVLAYFVLPTPPRLVPVCGLGNRATKMWHRTAGFSCSFLFRPAVPPAPRGRGRSRYFGYSSRSTGLCDSLFFLFRWYSFASLPSLRLW